MKTKYVKRFILNSFIYSEEFYKMKTENYYIDAIRN